jgi:hypothetical protein
MDEEGAVMPIPIYYSTIVLEGVKIQNEILGEDSRCFCRDLKGSSRILPELDFSANFLDLRRVFMHSTR